MNKRAIRARVAAKRREIVREPIQVTLLKATIRRIEAGSNTSKMSEKARQNKIALLAQLRAELLEKEGERRR